MISTEERNRKPYALPVQCLPYKGLKDSEIWDIGNKVIQEMHKRGMKVAGMFCMYNACPCTCMCDCYVHVLKIIVYAGFVTNGEWNSNRTKGNTRPLSVFQIRSDVHSKYSRMGEKRMLKMITPQCKSLYFITKYKYRTE